MNVRSSTAPPYGTNGTGELAAEPRDPAEKWRLAGWLALVLLFAAVAYATRAASGKPDPQTLYEWGTAVGVVVQDGVVLLIVLLIARNRHDLLALRRPGSLRFALASLGIALAAIYVFEVLYGSLVHTGNEQGLTPAHWEPRHAAAYAANAVVICTVIPFVEELTYRGVGFSLLRRFGRWPTIFAVGLLFGLAHGLLLSLPVLVAFGCALAWIRDRTDSAIPGMFLHATFNLVALVVAVTV